MTSTRTSHIFKMDGGNCYAGNELVQIKEQTEEHPKLGLVGWKRFNVNERMSHSLQAFFELANTTNSFMLWMDEKQIASSCPPKILELFLEGKVSKLGPSSKQDEDKAMEEEMKVDVVSLVERCDKLLERYKENEIAQDSQMTMFSNNMAILAAYAKVPELIQCLLDSGVVKTLAEAMLNTFRDEDLHENSSQVLHALVSHNYDIKSTDIILQLVNVISELIEDDEIGLQFEGVTLSVIELFASTVKVDSTPALEQMPHSEVPGKICYSLLNKYLNVLKMIDSDGIVCSSGPLHKRFEFAMMFADLMDDLFVVMGWGPHLLKGSEKGSCHGRQQSNASIFTGLATVHHLPQPVKSSTKYKSRKDFPSEHEYGRYIKSVLKEDMWVKARCPFDGINAGQKGQFRFSNSRSPPARVDWEGYGLHWVHWNVLEIIEENNGEDDKELEQPSSTNVQRKHPYGLGVTGSHGDTVERNDWWEVMFYLRKLDPSQFQRILTMLPSYGIKGIDDMVELLPTVQEARQIISHMRKHHPLLLAEPLSLEDGSVAQPHPQDDCSNADQVTIKSHPPMEDPYLASEEIAPTPFSVVRASQHDPSHLGRGYSSSLIELSFGPEENSSSEEEVSANVILDGTVPSNTTTPGNPGSISALGNPSNTADDTTISDTVSNTTSTVSNTTSNTVSNTTSNTTSNTVGNTTSNTVSNTTSTVSNTTSNTVSNTTSNVDNTGDSATGPAGLRRSSRIAVKPRKSFADIVSGKVNYETVSTSSQPKKKKKKKKTKKELDYNALEVKLNLASAQLMHDYLRFCAKVDEVLKVVTGDSPHGYRILARCLSLMQNGLRHRHGRLLVEDALSGGFKSILRAMQLGAQSAHVQCLGITCFFYQMGRCSYGYSVINIPCDLHSREERNSIMAIVHSLVSSHEHGGLRTLVRGLYRVANQYNKEMSDTEKRSSVEAVTNGLVVLANVLHADGTLIGKMADWDLPKCLEVIRSEFPVFPGKGQLIGMMNRFPISNSTPSSDEKYCQEMCSLIQQLDGDSCQTAVFQLLGRISNSVVLDNCVTLVTPPDVFVRSIIHYQGIVKLVNLLERPSNISSSVCTDIVLIIGCTAYAGCDQCGHVILQGGVRGLVTILNQTTHPRRLQLLAIKVLSMIAEDANDNRAAIKTQSLDNCLTTLMERYDKDQEVKSQLEDVHVMVRSADDVADSTKKLLVGILSGTMHLIVRHINDCRRQQNHVILPRLGNFVQYMSSVLSGSTGVQEQCWERIEVSSGNYHKDHLTDGNKLTYWESSGRSGSHWIRLYLKKDVIIRSLAITVDSGDSSYTPQKVTVEGGGNLAQLSVLSNIVVEQNTHGSVTLLSDMKKHYSIINIKIKQCYQGGIDARVRGLTITGSQFNPLWSVFGEVLSDSTGVFYYVLTRTWSQETQPNLLDLFDRLSDRVAYEQQFADMHLHSTISKETLGQACHQYLIQPLAKTFTNDGGDKQLSDLIGQYLQHMLCPSLKNIIPVANGNQENSCDHQVDVADWVAMSRVRCMCRLLVDCGSFNTAAAAITNTSSTSGSTTNPTTVANKGRVLKKGNSSCSLLVPAVSKSSSDALVQCWKGTVKQQLQEVMASLLTDDRPHGMATGLLNIYTKLKCAMRELFGGHSRYAIALKEGFAEQLQTLSESHSVQFCQSFCASIDSLLNVTGPDYHQFSAAMETDREAILTQLAEPLQFIHNLDLSHVFEHYYRYYLSTRILHGWTVSLSLERRLVQLFAHCFPRKYPMLMLADLDQSKQLMDRFCDSELLESLDTLLSTSRLRKPHEYSVAVPGVTELAQKCSFYKRHTLQVYTLTPCHWPLGCQPLLPLQALPHPLQQFCNDYQSFYTSATGDNQSHNRKLEWTVHGYGCLSYNKLQLMVSTTQMIVLLQYNRSEIHRFHSLQASTQLGEELLSHTLLSLTSQPHNILTASAHCSSGLFSPNTVFALNHKFSSDVAKRHRSHCIWMHNAQVAVGNHSNKQVDLSHLFERRRNIIDAAVVRILKRDREVSMDTIAGIVIKGCSTGQFEGGIPFERFECTNRDVCFRIDRLVTDGYLHRCDEHPQMILYQPSNIELSSNSQSGSHDQRRASPICRKRSLATGEKMTASGVTRSKRRPTDVPSHTHMVTKTMTSSSLTFEQVKALIVVMVTRISEVIKLPSDQVEWLLRRHQWSEDAVIQKYLTLGDGILTEAGLNKPRTAVTTLSQRSSTCKVCLNEISDIASLPCQHIVCKSCCRQYLTTRLKQNVSLDTTCPTPSCKQPVTRATFQQLLNTDAMGQYELAVVKSYVEMSKWFTWCRNPQGCGMALRKGDGSKSGTCSKCHWSSCFTCTFTEAHEPASCKEMTQWMEAGGYYEGMGEDAKSKQLSKMISKLCPGCSAPIEKNEGCLHMKCKCGCDFCWRCLKSWKPSHSDYYSCSAKASKAAQDVRKFVDFNQRCSQHHTSHGFARRLCHLVQSINEPVNMNHLTFIVDACELLSRCHKLLAYACVSDFFRTKNSTDVFTFLTEHLESDTNALQAFLENTLLSSSNVARSIRRLTERQLTDGYQLVNKINSTRDKLLVGADQLRFGVVANEATNEVVIPSVNTGASSLPDFSSLWGQEPRYSDDDNNMIEYDDDIYSSSDRYGDSPYYIGSPYYCDSDCYFD